MQQMGVRETRFPECSIKTKSFQIHQENKFSLIWLEIVKNVLFFFIPNMYTSLYLEQTNAYFFSIEKIIMN